MCIFWHYYCGFSYAGTWELVNLFVGTKHFSYHICYESIGGKHNTLKSRDRDRELVKKNVLNEINKEGSFTQGFKDCSKIKTKVP